MRQEALGCSSPQPWHPLNSIPLVRVRKQVLNKDTAADLWKYSTIVTGASWPPANQPKEPCPTLKVMGAVTEFMNRNEEVKRTRAGTADQVDDAALEQKMNDVLADGMSVEGVPASI